MDYLRKLILVAGIFFGLLLMLPLIGLPYSALDWTAYSQLYEPTQTPTGTVALTPTSTVTVVATATATLTPTPTPEHRNYLPLVRRSDASSVSGSVLIEGGRCCVGGRAGTTVNVDVAFQATSPFGPVTQMRTRGWYGGRCLTESEMTQIAWEPFADSKTFPVTVAINWIGFYASVQYRDAGGYTSRVYCDDISVEGMPAP